MGTDTDWASFELGATQLCGVKTNDTLWCGDIPDAPTQLGSDTDWIQVATNDSDHACARKSSGALYCWGANDVGQLGLGSTTQQNLPTQVGTDTDWDHVSVGESFTCAVKTDDTLWCWGSNDSGQLGIGGAWQPTAVQVGL